MTRDLQAEVREALEYRNEILHTIANYDGNNKQQMIEEAHDNLLFIDENLMELVKLLSCPTKRYFIAIASPNNTGRGIEILALEFFCKKT